MKILITGGTGLIGKSLVKKLEENNHEIRALVREKPVSKNEFYWDIAHNDIDLKALENIDSIIHLAGATIFQRWTEKNKKAIISSRVDTANFLLEKVKNQNIHLKSFISASGINFYGTYTSDQIFTENNGIAHQDFLSEVCEKWESAAQQFQICAERIVIFRTSPVFSNKGGSFEQLKRITDYNLVAALGSGKQWFPWIHLEDLIKMYVEAVENPNFDGIYNAVSDEIPTNKGLMKLLAKKSNKLFIPIHVPSFLLKLVLGKMSEMLLEGSRASNDKIKSAGFQFQFPTLEKALDDLIAK